MEKYESERDGFIADVYCRNQCTLGASEFKYGQKCKMELNPLRIDGVEVKAIDIEQNFCNRKPKKQHISNYKALKPSKTRGVK